MITEYVGGVHIVRVAMTNHPNNAFQLWVAATPAADAVAAVKKQIPQEWTAELISQRVTKELANRLKLRDGEVSELSSAG
jgi:hypothetical protein